MKNSSFITKYLVARNNPPKQRLEFPVVREHRKHYGEGVRDQVVLAHDERNYSLKSAKHSNLDVSDIDGARPRIGPKARSEKHLNWPSSVDNAEIRDELDHLVRGKLHKRDLSLKQLGRLNQLQLVEKQKSDGNITALENRKMELMNARDIYKHLKTEPSQNDYAYPQLDKRKIVEAQEGNIRQNPKKKSILQNPTFLSSVFFA